MGLVATVRTNAIAVVQADGRETTGAPLRARTFRQPDGWQKRSSLAQRPA
jgi:hypothetical protein